MEKFEIKNRYGLRIVGEIHTPKDSIGVAFVLHGLSSFKEQPQIQMIVTTLFRNMYTVVNFDATNSFNESGGKYEDATVQKHYEDMFDVINWAKTQTWYREPFVIVGTSLGGYAALRYTEEFPHEVKAIFPKAAFISGKLNHKSNAKYNPEKLKTWQETGWLVEESISHPGIIKRLPWSHMEERLRHDVLPEIGKITMPVLLAVGGEDIHRDEQKVLYDAISSTTPKELHIIENAPHTFRDLDHLHKLGDILDTWLKKNKMIINLKTIKKVYFLGIGGIGVSAIARMMKSEGKDVSGLDASESEIVEALRKEGIAIAVGPNSSDIPEGTELVVYTRALEVADEHILEEVKEKNIPLLSYPEVLKMISENKYTIAIAGMHGKTTTTAMCSHVLKASGMNPTTIVGSIMKDVGSNFLAGTSEYFIIEADEYRRSFHNLSPRILVITNIDEDHLDYYKDIDDIKDAFHTLVMKVPSDGLIVCNPNAPYVQDVIRGAVAPIVDYAHNLADVPDLLTPGQHNRENAACVFALGRHLGLHRQEIEQALASFAGTWRRFEYIGKSEVGALVYDDYGHHPTEIEATLSTARDEFGTKKVYVVFHPHLYSRTKLLLHDFARSLAREGMEILLPPIYPAREAHDPTISSDILAKEIQNLGGVARVFPDFDQIQSYLSSILTEHDVVLTLGAGESNKVAYALARQGQ